MNFIYIVTIIILIGETVSSIENTTSINISNEQKALLRKLQNFQDPKDEAKALTWNELLADVLVNSIKIFPSNKNDNEIVKEYSEPSKTKKVIISCFSEVLLIYKNCIYDRWKWIYEEPEFAYIDTTSEPGVIIKTDDPLADVDGPKSEVEIIEPKYHGKLEEDSREDREKKGCPEGNVRDEEGNCVKEISRLLISVPNHCPSGYRLDRLGNCRMILF